MESGASENKQTVCKDVNKKARKGICTARQGCLEHRWHCALENAPEVKYTTSWGAWDMGPSMGRVWCGVGGPGRDAVKRGTGTTGLDRGEVK